MLATPQRRFNLLGRMMVGVLAALSCFAVVGTGLHSGPVSAAGVDPDDWLAVVNTYRSQSGLGAVSENGAWASGTKNHSCWMLLNGIAHDEPTGTPGYTTDGDAAGNAGNVAVSSASTVTAKGHVDLWMSGPFHAIGILRAGLSQTSYAATTGAHRSLQHRSSFPATEPPRVSPDSWPNPLIPARSAGGPAAASASR